MVKNLWKNTKIVCGNHGDDYSNELTIHPSADMSKDIFYSCPKYYPENRTSDEKACRNHVSILDVEELMNFLSEKFDEYDNINLEGYKWTSKKGIEYKILKQTNDNEFVISALNHKGLQ